MSDPLSAPADVGPPDSEIVALLKGKRTMLSSQGFMITDLYYNAFSSTVSLVEATVNYGRTNFGLTNLTFGGTAQVTIPNNSFLGEVYLVLQINSLPANVGLPRGWGLAAINQLSFLLGASNVPNLSVSGQSLFQWLCDSLETAEKRSEIFRLMGEFQPSSSSAQQGPFFAYVPLILPFAKYGGLVPKLMFDTSMYNAPIQLFITFNNANQFMAGTPTVLNGISKFDSGRVFLKQMDLANRAMSIARRLKTEPNKIFTYPFIHGYSYTLQAPFVAGVAPGSTPINTYPLQSFINADLVAISIGVVRNTDLVSFLGTTPLGNGSLQNAAVNPFNYVNISDVSIVFNGLPMIVAPAAAWKLYNMSGQLGSQAVANVVMAVGGTSSAPTYSAQTVNGSTNIATYVFIADFTQKRALQFENHYNNVWRIPNQTLQLQFNVPIEQDPSASLGTNRPSPDNYTVLATYFYNGAIENSGGESRIYFD